MGKVPQSISYAVSGLEDIYIKFTAFILWALMQYCDIVRSDFLLPLFT